MRLEGMIAIVTGGGSGLGEAIAIPEIKKRGGGAIVNTSSIAGTISIGGAHYTASKGGGVMMTKTLAVELARDDIRVNAIGPAS